MSTKKKPRKPRRKRLHIYLHDDNVNSFEYVVKVLMSICGHNMYQAEQCAMITHNTGESHIYSGLGNDPYIIFELLIKHGLTVQLKDKKL
jgi:ATP-dependent Clp protease adaptor protein ClpS